MKIRTVPFDNFFFKILFILFFNKNKPIDRVGISTFGSSPDHDLNDRLISNLLWDLKCSLVYRCLMGDQRTFYAQTPNSNFKRQEKVIFSRVSQTAARFSSFLFTERGIWPVSFLKFLSRVVSASYLWRKTGRKSSCDI